ncbi:MAG: hypothetical protein DRJ40_05630 [Thermoprotei archaeon]|nr:MAG: hypothetical protein DRJ40_05630 [Thermoprotei archaeon]
MKLFEESTASVLWLLVSCILAAIILFTTLTTILNLVILIKKYREVNATLHEYLIDSGFTIVPSYTIFKRLSRRSRRGSLIYLAITVTYALVIVALMSVVTTLLTTVLKHLVLIMEKFLGVMK